MVRRPITTLVAQGILPSPSTSPALYEQRQKLERAIMGDNLRAKIARRPDRAELVHRHILEDVRPGVDPSLCDKQRQLKRAKLADTLSNQLQARPGPLELVAKNILHVVEEESSSNTDCIKDESSATAFSPDFGHPSKWKEDPDSIPLPEFIPTNQGLPLFQVEVPHKYTLDDDSNSEISGVQSPADVFSSIGDSPRCMSDVTSPSTPSSFCQSKQMSPKYFMEATAIPVPKLVQQFEKLKEIPSSSAVVKSGSHDAIFSSFTDLNSKPLKSSQSVQSTTKVKDSATTKQHKRRSSAADASIFVAPSPQTTGRPGNAGTRSGQSSSSQSPSPSPSLSQNIAVRPGALQLKTSEATQAVPYSQRGAPGKDQTNRRKSAKGKKGGHGGSGGVGSSSTGGKQKMIKFHEYKVCFVSRFLVYCLVIKCYKTTDCIATENFICIHVKFSLLL